MQAMLLAAGFGTRLRPYSELRPKPLFPVCNRPLLFHLLDTLRQAGCTRMVVNCHHLAGQIERAVDGMADVVLQREPEILGTGGSLRQALPLFGDGPVLVMNGDIFHTIDLRALHAHHNRSGNLVTMAVHDCARFNTVRVDGTGRVRGFGGVAAPGENLLAFTGVQVVEPEVIKGIPQAVFHHVIDLYAVMAGAGEAISALRVDGAYWRDMGTPDDYLQLHGDLLQDRVPGFAAPPGNNGWLIGPEAQVDPSATLSGWGCIGSGAVIGPRARLRDCVVWDGARVAADWCHEQEIITGP